MKGKTPDSNQFLAGGGEMGELIRKKDWSNTPVGNPDTWPQSLRTTLSIILNAKFPMFLWWGPELICFYNDAYRPSLGKEGKHPSILGMKAKEAWTEIWPVISPLIQQVLDGGESTWSEDQLIPIFRNGRMEDVYWTFSYSPVKDESGNIAGVLVTCNETTEKVVNFKLLEESKQRYLNNILQAPVAMCILRGEDFIVEIANEPMLELWGKLAEQVMNKPIFEGLPEAKGQGLEELMHHVYTTGEKFVANERQVNLPRNGKVETTYMNFAYEALRESNGTISGIVVIAAEVTLQIIARKKIEESEERFRNLVMQSPIPMTIFRGEEYIIEIANPAMIETVWRKKEKDVLGKKVLDVFPELKQQKYPELLRKVYTTGNIHRENESIAYVQGDDGMKLFYLDYEYAPLLGEDGSVSGLIITVSDVTEKVEAKKKLEESEKRFRNVADNAPVLIWMSGTDKLCYFFNKAWLRFTGRTIEQERGNGWVEGVHADDLQRCLYTYVTAFEKEEEFYMEYRLKRHDGEYRWISDHGVPRINSDGTFEGYIGACMDVNERVIYQTKLKEDEERLSIIIGASGLGTWELNLATDEIKYSDRFLEILGHQEGVQITHEQMIQQLYPGDKKIREKAFKLALQTSILHYETRLIWSDKSIHWMEARGKVYYNEKSQPTFLVGTVRDITEQKLFQQKLQEREQKFRLLADSMPQHVWTGDAEGNLNYFNQSVYEFSGLTKEEINKNGWLQIVHPEDREENIQAWMHAIKTGEDFLFEHRFRRHDGEYRWQLSRATPQTDIFGNIQMWVGSSTDIQEQKMFTTELERQVRERTRELKQKNKDLEKMNTELQSFAYISSHDLQEPLRKIQMFAARILEKEDKNLSENGKTYFNGMQKAAQRMQTLIEDLLAYSRTNNTEKVFKKTDLNELISEVQNDFKETLAQKNGLIELEEVCEANIIPFQIRQLFYNLISNSIKFSVPDRPLRVRVKCRIVKGSKLEIPSLAPEKEHCHVSISDNGIGFDPQYRERIFEVFQRLHGKEEYTGTGIGLAIVKKIVDNHGGVIMATGELNKGATFDIYFPA